MFFRKLLFNLGFLRYNFFNGNRFNNMFIPGYPQKKLNRFLNFINPGMHQFPNKPIRVNIHFLQKHHIINVKPQPDRII